MIPVLAIFLYGRLGDPAASAVAAATDGGQELSDPQIAAMVGALERRLSSIRTTPKAWALLARSYYVLGRFPAAAEAYTKALARAPDNPDLLADYADTLGMMQGRHLAGKPLALVERALAIDPKHGRRWPWRRRLRWRHTIPPRRSPTGTGSLRSCRRAR